MSLRFVLVAAVVALMTITAPAVAQQASATDLSADLKRRGDDLMHSGDFKGALVAYDEAYGLDANPAILYNRSRALESMGEWVKALEALEKFDHDASPELKARVPKLETLMKEQRTHVAMLSVTSPIAGATISVRNEDLGKTPLAAPLRTNAGAATIEVRADGYQTFHASMDLPGGTLTTIDAPLLKIGEKAPPPPPPPAVEKRTRSRVPSIVLGAGAIALAGAGAVLLGVREMDANKLKTACPDGLCPADRQKELSAVRDRALVEGPIAAGLFIGAGVCLGVAVALWPWQKSETRVAIGDRAILIEGAF